METLLPLIVAAIVVGMSKGGLASTAAIAVPMLSFVMSPVQAAAILLPVFIVTDWVAVWMYRRDYSSRNLAILVPAIVAGIAIATVLTPYLSETALLVITAGIGLWYCGRTWLGGRAKAATRARLAPGLFWGTITGITSFITHSGSPPAQAYLLPQKLPRLEFAGTIAISFAIGNLVKLPSYWALGQLDALDPLLTAELMAAGIAGTILGRRIVRVVPDAAYARLIEGLLFVLSVLLLGKAAGGLL